MQEGLRDIPRSSARGSTGPSQQRRPHSTRRHTSHRSRSVLVIDDYCAVSSLPQRTRKSAESGLRKQSEELIRAMTNSAPKLNNKVERHSPKWSGKKQRTSPAANNQQQQRKPAVPISIPPRTQSSNRWLSSSPSSMSSGGWSPKSHQSPFSASAKTSRRSYQSSSPGSVSSRTESPRGSPTNNFYAGAKFAEPPSPLSLPKPPTHWTGSDCAMQQLDCPFTAHLKMVLKVQA